MPEQHYSKQERTSLLELALLFLRLGTTAFGGPAAHIAIMEDEVVTRRRWLSRQKFLDLLGATNLIPGPNSTELAIHIGHQKRGWSGLLIAGSCFILPAVIIVLAIAWAYVRFGRLPQVLGILYGVKPVVIVIVLQALYRLGRSALKTKFMVGICVISLLLTLIGVHELLVLLIAGVVSALWHFTNKSIMKSSFVFWGYIFQGVVGGGNTFGLLPLFLFFLKVGSVLFGSGYVLLAFLRGDLVERWHWLTNSQLLDAVAVGQITPGPVFTTATFIGYVLGGFNGAALATIGIFLPAFVFVALSGPLIPRLRRSQTAGAFLDAVNAGSLALMVVVTYELGRSAIIDRWTIVLTGVSAILLFAFRINSTWLILGGALLGWALAMWGHSAG